jgi:hypothetical protein
MRKFDEKLRAGHAFIVASSERHLNVDSVAVLYEDTTAAAKKELYEKNISEKVTHIEHKRRPNVITVETVPAQFTQEIFEL